MWNYHYGDWRNLGWLSVNKNVLTNHIIPASANLEITGKVVLSVTFEIRQVLTYFRRSGPEQFYSDLESIFIEMENTFLSTGSNGVIVVISCVPDSSVDV